MTKIKFLKSNGFCYGFEVSGHTEYDKNGKDILCASISTIAQSTILGVCVVLGLEGQEERDDKKGYLKFELSKNVLKNKLQKAQILFDTMYFTVCDLKEGYSKYISMEVIENVY